MKYFMINDKYIALMVESSGRTCILGTARPWLSRHWISSGSGYAEVHGHDCGGDIGARGPAALVSASRSRVLGDLGGTPGGDLARLSREHDRLRLDRGKPWCRTGEMRNPCSQSARYVAPRPAAVLDLICVSALVLRRVDRHPSPHGPSICARPDLRVRDSSGGVVDGDHSGDLAVH